MRWPRVVLAALLLSLCLPAVAVAAEKSAGLDARLTKYPYPYPVKMHPVDSQGQKLEMAYMEVEPAGPPNGAVVLLLHGKNFSGAYWGTTMDALTAEGFRVIVPDQIGFGKSSKPAAYQFSFQALATHTKTLLESRGIDKVAVVGHSMGGMLATRFALMYPDATTRLALVNPIGLEDWKLHVPYTPVEATFETELKQTPEKVKAYFEKSYFDGQWKPAYDPLLEMQAGWIQGPAAEYRKVAWNSALTYDMIFTQPVLYEFPQVKARTLLIIGQRDRTALGKATVPPEVAEKLGNYPDLGKKAAKAIPNARLVEMQGIGHLPQYEAFETYISALEPFLKPDPPAVAPAPPQAPEPAPDVIVPPRPTPVPAPVPAPAPAPREVPPPSAPPAAPPVQPQPPRPQPQPQPRPGMPSPPVTQDPPGVTPMPLPRPVEPPEQF